MSEWLDITSAAKRIPGQTDETGQLLVYQQLRVFCGNNDVTVDKLSEIHISSFKRYFAGAHTSEGSGTKHT